MIENREPSLTISEKILETVKTLEIKGRNPEYCLQFGGRRLTLVVIESLAEIMDYLENITDTPEIGSTTELYKAAKILMQKIVDKKQKNLHYVMRTKNSTLREWAQKQGNEIFAWDSQDVDPEPLGDSIFKKEFIAKQNI